MFMCTQTKWKHYIKPVPGWIDESEGITHIKCVVAKKKNTTRMLKLWNCKHMIKLACRCGGFISQRDSSEGLSAFPVSYQPAFSTWLVVNPLDLPTSPERGQVIYCDLATLPKLLLLVLRSTKYPSHRITVTATERNAGDWGNDLGLDLKNKHPSKYVIESAQSCCSNKTDFCQP